MYVPETDTLLQLPWYGKLLSQGGIRVPEEVIGHHMCVTITQRHMWNFFMNNADVIAELYGIWPKEHFIAHLFWVTVIPPRKP